MRRRLTAFGLCLAALAVMQSQAALAGDPAMGHALAKRWCSECHLVDARQDSASDQAPPFMTIAQDPATTRAGLATWLSDPHPPMPKLELARQDIDDLVAYIESLKAQ